MKSRIIAISLLIAGPAVIAVAVTGLALESATGIDTWWNELMGSWRAAPLDAVAYFLASFGAGALGFGLVPALLSLCLLITARRREVIGLILVGAVSLLIVQTLKPLLDRARPEDMLTLSDAGSYPSGHVTNAATLLVFVGVVYARPWVWALAGGYIVLMAWSRTYLHAHWLSDTVAGIVLGSALACLAFAVVELSRTPGLAYTRTEPICEAPRPRRT